MLLHAARILVQRTPVFVWIGKFTKSFGPIATPVWLKCLYLFHVRGTDALEPALGVPVESGFRVCNRKLRVVLLNTGIEFGEFKNEVIEGTAKVVTDFPDQNWNAHGALHR